MNAARTGVEAPLAGKGEGGDGKWSQLSLAVMLRRPTRHPDHCVVRYSYGEALRPRTLNLRCSLLIRTACSSQTSTSWRSGRPWASR